MMKRYVWETEGRVTPYGGWVSYDDAEAEIEKARKEAEFSGWRKGKDAGESFSYSTFESGIRADERERIVREIETERTKWRNLFLPGIDHILEVLGHPVPKADDHSLMPRAPSEPKPLE